MNKMIISYLTLRKVIGFLGISLAFICIVGGLAITSSIEQSISAYYYTVMRNIFVGTLITSGAFLMTYKGYDFKDNFISFVSGFSAVGVALFPSELKAIHFTFAALFFLSLAYMSYFQFTKGSNKKRNKIYRVCGIVILISILLFPILSFPYSILILEIIMLLAFGISWITKGKAIIKDIK